MRVICRQQARCYCWVSALIGLASWLAWTGAAGGAEPIADFRFQAVSGESLGLWDGSQPVLVYNQGVIHPPRTPGARGRSSYIHPLYGLDGETLTDDFPQDHTYHRGVFWAWPHVQIGDQEYDQWSLRDLASEFQRWTARDVSPNEALLGIENGWFAGGRQVVREQVTIRVQPRSADSRAIDLELRWTPLNQPLTLLGAAGKSYGGFNFRFARPHRPTITTPAGRAADDLVVTRLPWVDYACEFMPGASANQQPAPSGAAIFVHPSHPDHPPTWMTRHYGLISVGWPGVEKLTLPANQPFTLRYRLWIHRGGRTADAIQAEYSAYCAAAQAPVTWHVNRLDAIGGHMATAVGSPRVIETPQGAAVEFDGQDDGLFLDANPLAGLRQFTAEVIFRPAAGGPPEQRFFHMQEENSDNRLLFETRLTADGRWFLDTFLKSGETNATLFAERFQHPLGPWYHAAVTVDGQTMRHFVNGVEEMNAAVKFAPLLEGRTSLGVRLNRVSWYRGAIRQIRITPRVLAREEFLTP
jgi:Methane oxygenase PmoA/Concanavalin A-like lectin/glucanases superfamily